MAVRAAGASYSGRDASASAAAARRTGETEAPGRWPLVRDGLAVLAVVLGLLAGVVVFLPAEGRVAAPVHDALALLLGRLTFLLPIALLTGGVLQLVHTFAPDVELPSTRLTGAALLAVATFPSVHLVALNPAGSLARAQAGEGGGLVGHWLGIGLLDWLGGPATTVVLALAVFVGFLLVFDLTLRQVANAIAWVAALLGFCMIRALGYGWRGVQAGAHASLERWRRSAGSPLRAGRSLGAVRIPRRRSNLPRFPFSLGRPARPRLMREGRSSASSESDSAPAERPEAPGAVVLVNRAPPGSARLSAPAEPEWYGQSSARARAAVAHPEAAPPPVEDEEPAAGGSLESPRHGVEAHARVAAPSPVRISSAATSDRPVRATTRWRLPAVDVFQARGSEEVSAPDLEARSRLIEQTLADFNIEARVVEVNHGPAVTQFGLEPAMGVPVSKILSRQNDLALRLGVSPIRLEAPVPGKQIVGVEVPNSSVSMVALRDVIDAREWERAGGEGKLRLALGRDVAGVSIVGNLAKMPHLLIAGATGAGKSVCINTIVGSLLYQFTPDELQLLMIDPKRVELVGFSDVPHLRLPVITEMDKVVGALKWVVQEMDRRYKLFAEHGARNLEGYNRRAADANRPEEPALPFLVVIIDELADMMMTAAEEVEKTLCRLAQLARATGIHLVVATQRPSVDVLTGLIKANFPTRIAFAVSSQTDSRVILDQAGADKLLGRGDALYMPTDAMKPIRLQGAFVSDEEMQALVTHWKDQGAPRYSVADLHEIEALGRGEEADEDVYERAVELAETVGRLSVSLMQRRLGLGRDRAQRLLDRLVDEGLAER